MAGRGSGGSSGHGGGGGGSGHGNGSNSGNNNGSDNGTATNNGQQEAVELGGNYKNEPESDDKPPEGYNPGEVTHSDNGVHFRESYSNGTVGYENNASAYAENGTAYAGFESEVFAGPGSSTTSGYARADANFDGQVQLGAEAQVKQEVSVDVGAADISASANARAAAGVTLSPKKTQIGAEASVGVEAKIGTGGNELVVGVGAGVGGGVEIIHGEDSDGDGQEEIGASISLKWIAGGSIGFKFEPEAAINGVKDFLGLGEKSPAERLSTCVEHFESVLEMKQANEAYDRLQSLL